MKQKNFTLSPNPAKSWFGYLSKLVALVLLVSGLGTAQRAWGQSAAITDDAITLSVQPTNMSIQNGLNYAGTASQSPYSTYTKLGRSNTTNGPAVPQLGTFDLDNNSSIVLTGAALQGVVVTGNTQVSASRLQYRVYLTGASTIPQYSELSFTTNQASTTQFSSFSGGVSGTNINLLSGLTSGGTYIIEVRFQADLVATDDPSSTAQANDLSGSKYYYANFYVTPPAVTPAGGTTTWQGTARGANGTILASDQDWTNTANWSNGVPTATSNAIIPPKSGASIVYPFLNDPTYDYSVNNLTLQGNSGSTAAQLVINIATLFVYGNLTQPAGGVVGNVTNASGVTNRNQNSTIVFAGANQVITGQLLVSDIIIAGSGVKSVINTIIPSNIIAFRPASATNGVIVQSAAFDSGSSGSVSTAYLDVFDTTGNSYISLTANSIISTVPGEAETNVSYIKGVTRVDRTLTSSAVAGTSATTGYNSFGNIGLELRANHTPGTLFVFRVVGDPLSGPVSSTAVPVKRYFKITGDDESTSAGTANSTIDIIFHYLNSTDELNGIQESDLALFRSRVNGAPYTGLGGTLNTTDKTVTRLAVPSISTSYITLGDKNNPLPVTLVAFNAVRSNASTLLTWKTASELDNKGFNVQVSADGVTYRTLAFVASKSPNSSNEQSYGYTDTESSKTGTRYYRLEQVDLDGKLNYSPVRAVNFDGAAATTLALVAYPNPFSDTIGLTIEGATASTTEGVAFVKLVDMAGRTVRDQKVSLSGASLSLGDLSALRSGLYLAKVTFGDGSTQVVRVQKQ